MARAGRSWILAWLVLLLAVVDLGIDGSEEESNGMLLVWLSGRTGGSLIFEWAVAPAWEQTHSMDDIETFSVYVGDSKVAALDRASRKYTLFGLAANTEYGVQIAAQMAAGVNATNAPVSDAVLARTTAVSSPGKPGMPYLLAYSGGTIEVAADIPEETGGANLTSITVVVRNFNDQIVVNKTQSSKFPAIIVNHLDAQTYYSITSFVTNEAGLSSVEGSKLSVQTGKLDLPGPCPPPTILSTTGGSVRLQLNPPVDDGGARISSYVVFMAVNGSDTYEEVTSFPVGSAIDTVDVFTLPGYSDSTPLHPSTEYRFKALAVNLADICTALSSSVALAQWASARTLDASVPDAPPAPYFISATGGQIVMYLVQPRDMNGSSLTGFSVSVDDIATGFVAASSNVLYRLSFLAANTSYSVRVAAVTDLGSTFLSDKVVMKTSSVTQPSSPKDVIVSEVSASSARIQWSIPLDSGGSNIAGYTVSVTSSAKTYQIYAVSTYLILNTLSARTVYTVKVIAINDFGYKSAASGVRGVSFETLPMVAPSSPWNLSSLSRSGGTIEVAWNPPVETGGAALTELQYNTSIFSVVSCGAESTSRTCGSCNAVSLGDGYVFLSSDKACSLSIECPDGSSTCCVHNNNTSTVSDSLCAVAIQTPRYQVTKGTNSTVFYDLNHSSVYYFGVRVVNSVGSSPYSAVTALHTGPPSKPSFPLKLVQSNSSGGSIQLSWRPPLDRGGSIIIGYRVYRDLERLIDLSQTTYFTDCGNLTSSMRYKYSVTAINASRDEGDMAFIAASTTTLTPPLTPTIDVVERTGDSLRLRISPACDNGGVVAGLIYQYKVARGVTTVAMSSFDCCTFVVRDLALNQLYNVQVRSMNGVGASTWAMKQISTSSGVPSPPSILVEMVNTYSVMLRFDSFDQEVVSFVLFFCAANGQWHSISFTCDIDDVHSCPPTYRIDALLANSTYQAYVQATGVAGSTNSSTLIFSTLNEPNGLFQFESSFYSTSIGGSILASVIRVGGSGGAATVDMQFESLIAVAMACSCENSVGCSCTITSDVTAVSTASQVWQMKFVDGQAAQNISVKIEDKSWNISQPFTSTLRLVGESASAQANTMLRIGLSQSTGVAMFTGSTSKVLENDSYAVVDLVRLAGMAGPMLMKIETFDITAYAGEDYVELSGDVAFADQQTNASIWIKLFNDVAYRGDRSFGIRIINQSGDANQSLATHEVVIIDDDDVQRAIPNVPGLPVLIQATGGEIELNCGGSVSSSSSQEGFVVRIAPFAGSAFYSFYNMSDSIFVLSGLSPRTTLRIALAAWNAYGMSAYSSEMTVRTTEPSSPSSPRSLRVSAVTGTAAMLEWNPPRDDGGSSISGYDVKVLGSGSDLIRSYRVRSLYVLVTDLSVTTEYVAYVSAVSIAFSTPNFERSNCSMSILTTNGTVPSQPPAVKMVNRSRSGGSLSLEFQSPNDNGGWPIFGYSLFLRQRDSSAPIEVASGHQDSFREGCVALCGSPASVCTCTVYKLMVNTEYEVYAVAYNAQGASLEGNITIVSTNEDVTLPSPPVNFKASVVTSGNILLSWELPLDLGGASDVIGYMVYQAFNTSVNSSVFNVYDGQDSPKRFVLLRGFQRNSQYEFEIVALNSASYCVSTADRLKSPRIVVSTLAYSELTPPQSLTIVSATGGAIEIAWSPPDDLAGVPLYGYYVSLVEKERNQSTFLTNYMLSDGTLSFTHYQLKEATKYCYTVIAWNQDGPSDPSEILCSSTASVTAPSTVWNLIPTGFTGGQINISWESPRDTGGRDIVYYEIVRTELWGSMSTFSTIVTETALIDSTELRSESGYLYRIIPFNSVYQGQASYLSVWTGLPTLPRAPVVTDVIPFGGKIEVHWQPDGDTGGLDIISYTIILWSGDMLSKIEERTLNETSATFGNLLARTQYTLTLSSSNAVGASPSVENLVVTESPDLPGIPSPPEAANILGGSLLISVAFPEYRGGAEVTLVLYQGPNVVYIFPVDKTYVTIYGLLAKTQYAFRVGARNIEGETLSAELQVVTGAISTPSQVQNVAVTAESFDSFELSWDRVQDSGGDSTMFYNVTYFRCGSDHSPLEASMTLVAISDTSAKISSLVYSSRYCIRVVAVTGTFLVGPASSTVEAWTEDPLQGVAIAEQGKLFVKEDSGYAVVPVKRVNGSYGNMSFTFFTTSNTAFDETNFIGSNGTMEMFSRVNEAFVTIQILNDATYNPNISFLVTVVDDLTLVSSSTTVTILDDGDAGFLSFASAHVDYLENSGIIQLGITRSRAWSPLVVIEPFLSGNHSILDRFHLLETNLTFDEGVTDQTLTIQIIDDSQYQLVPDSINVSFRIVHGGALYGLHPVVNITADDDGDVSLPHNCTSLRKVGATGGSIALQWSAPIDRGGANVVLSYIVEGYYRGTAVVIAKSDSESMSMYGLNASTAYDFAVRAANSAGEGNRTFLRLVSTTAASLPTAPQSVQLLSASSSNLLVSWLPPVDTGGTTLVGYHIYNVSASGSLSLFGSVSCTSPTQCTIKGLVAITPYTIQVRAITAFSTNGPLSPSTVYFTSNPDLPDAPPTPSVPWISAGAMTITMEDPLNVGGSDIREYRVYIKMDGSSTFDLVYSGSNRNCTIYRLSLQTVYSIKFQAVNIVGPSDYSPTLIKTTLERSLPSAPADLRLTSATGGALYLAWNEPLDVGGRDITGYEVTITSINGTNVTQLGYDGRGDATLGGAIFGLNATTSYLVYVVAFTDVSNCFGESQRVRSAEFGFNTTQPTVPGTPTNFLAVSMTGGLIELAWLPSGDTGGIQLTGFTVYAVAPTGGLLTIYASNNTKLTTFKHTGLTEATSYSYLVVASNRVGDSPASATLALSTTPATPPSPPLNVTQLSYRTGGAIQIGWSPPIDTGGQPVLSYWVYRNGILIAQDIPAQIRNYTDKGNLNADTTYSYSIRVYSQSGLGSDLSDSCQARTSLATVPKPPQLIASKVGSSNISVSWVDDSDTGGLNVVRYNLLLLKNSVIINSFSGGGNSYTFVGLNASSSYTINISSVSAAGSSQSMSANFWTLAGTVPGSPNAPLAVSIYGGNFTVQITPPVDNGGTPILTMKLFEQTRGFLATLNVGPSSLLQYSFVGATSMTNYAVWCSATNAIGEGQTSLATVIRTGPMSRPGAIAKAPQVVVSSGTSLSLVWQAPMDFGGGGLLSYDLRVLASNYTVVTLTTLAMEAVVSGLRFNTVYNISVRSTNDVGAGDWSPSLSTSTQPDAAGQLNFVASTASVLENATFVSLPVRRSNGLSGKITLTYAALNTGSATIGKDFALIPGSSTSRGTLDIMDQQNQSNIVVYILNDAIYESPDESFVIQLVTVTGTAILGANAQMTVTIFDDGDAGYVSIDKTSISVSEDAQVVVVPIIRERGSSGRVILQFIYNDITATVDRDYRKMMNNVVMEDGVTRSELRVAIINDRVFEFPDEIFQIRMIVVAGGAAVNRSSANITILDDGDVSVPAACPTPQVLATTGGLVNLLLGLPQHNGSASGKLSNYVIRLEWQNGALELRPAVNLSVQIGQLNASTTYNVAVAANNSVGVGLFSDRLVFTTTLPTLPGLITSVRNTTATGGSMSLSWSPPFDTGGVNITKYRLYIVSGEGTPQLAAENFIGTTSATVYGLSASTSYKFIVQAGNNVRTPELADGWGAISSVFTFATASPSLPGPAPINAGNYRMPTGGAVTLSWNAPLDNGGVPISSYSVYAKTATRGFSLTETELNLPLLYGTTKLLNASASYLCFVLARNQVTPTLLSGNLSVTAGSSFIQTTSDLSKVLQFGAVLAIQSAVVVVGNISKASPTLIPLMFQHVGSTVPASSGRLIGWATSFTTLNTTAATLPRPPLSPTLSAATGGALSFTFESPLDTGGIPILSFKVFINGKAPTSSSINNTGVVVSYLQLRALVLIGNLSPLTSYTITGVAVNALSQCFFGREATSNEIVFTTGEISKPSQPRVIATERTGGGIRLTIIDPLDTGGVAIQHYKIYFREQTARSVWILGYNGSDHRVTLAGLRSLTTYEIMATVSNSMFESDNSSVISPKTTGVSAPGACAPVVLVSATGGALNVSWSYPPDNGGSPVLSFLVSIASGEDGSGKIIYPATNLSFTFYGLWRVCGGYSGFRTSTSLVSNAVVTDCRDLKVTVRLLVIASARAPSRRAGFTFRLHPHRLNPPLHAHTLGHAHTFEQERRGSIEIDLPLTYSSKT